MVIRLNRETQAPGGDTRILAENEVTSWDVAEYGHYPDLLYDHLLDAVDYLPPLYVEG